MVRIKIISNPYHKEVPYQIWSEEQNEWFEINYANNQNSRLLNTELTQGFFPFQVKKIVDIIVEEYGIPGEEIEIYFEGTSDEFHELEEVCVGDNYENPLKPVWTDVGLENARDILPSVKKYMRVIKIKDGKDKGYKLDLIKMPHHGSYTGSLYAFFRTFMPDYIIISVGQGNRYGHPDYETMDLISNKKSSWRPKVYRTDQNGDIIVRSNGKELSVQTSK